MPISRDRIDAVIEDHDFLGGVAPDLRDRLLERAEVRPVEAGTILFHEGDRYQGFYLLLEGAAHVYRLSGEGRMLVLHVIRPGESFAEVPLFESHDPCTYPATAEALDDSTLLFFPAAAFRTFVKAHPASALQMLGKMARRLREAVHQLDAVSLQGVQERLARHLVKQVPTIPDDPETPPTVELDIPKSVLAAELGTVPETLSRALRSLEDDDLIRSEASAIVLTDVQGLRRLGHDG
jgi:CRP/FNR family transcriptional regulator